MAAVSLNKLGAKFLKGLRQQAAGQTPNFQGPFIFMIFMKAAEIDHLATISLLELFETFFPFWLILTCNTRGHLAPYLGFGCWTSYFT
jgi:hypothetical protein